MEIPRINDISTTLKNLDLRVTNGIKEFVSNSTTLSDVSTCSTLTEFSPEISTRSPEVIKEIESSNFNSNKDDHSQYEAIVSSDCQDVKMTIERPNTLSLSSITSCPPGTSSRRRLINFSHNNLDSPLSDDDVDIMLSAGTDSLEDDSILQQLSGLEENKIPELTLEEERAEMRSWKTCVIGGIKRKIDMRVIEPYKRVLSHGGYLTTGSYNAIITFSACYLPHKGRVDYNYVMDNLFFYVLSTLNQLITDDYVLVYLHGGATKDCMPTFSWLKRCYQMIDRKLKKKLKSLYLVHPTFWLKTLTIMIKPFISSKFSKKMHFVNSLAELKEILPIEDASIPDRVQQYDRLTLSCA